MTQKLIIFIGVLLAVASITGFVSARSARKTAKDAAAISMTLSNQLAEARAANDRKQLALDTLEVQRGLLTADITTASNKFAMLQSRLDGVLAEKAALETSGRSKDHKIKALESSVLVERNRAEAAEQRVAVFETTLAGMRSQLQASNDAMDALQSRANATEIRLAETLRKWNDPDAVRVQSEMLRQSGRGIVAGKKARLELQPDGSITATQ